MKFISNIFVCVIFFLPYSNSLLEFSPVSGIVDVNEGESYTIGFTETDDTTNITRCYYIADNIEGSFDVAKSSRTSQIRNEVILRSDDIENWGRIGYCRIDVKNAQENGPRSWKLIAYAELANLNITEEVIVNFFYNALLLNNKIYALEGSSFFQHIIAENITFVSCNLAFGGTILSLDLHTSVVYVVSTNETVCRVDAPAVVNRLWSLGHQNLCGFLLTDITLSDPTLWTISAADNENKNYRASAELLHYARLPTHTTKDVYAGGSVILQCGSEKYSFPEQQYCYLYNPRGALVFQDDYCSYTIGIVSLEHIGIWKCEVGTAYSMESLEFTVELIKKDAESVVTWVEDNDDYISVGCQLKNYEPPTASASFCEFMAPDKESFIIHTGSATERYTSLKTNLSARVCAIEIEKPLKDIENGIWKCQMKVINFVVGGFLHVGDVGVIKYDRSFLKTIQLYDAFSIICNVPYSAGYCHIESPNGTTYSTNDRYEASLGQCSLYVPISYETDNGTWICSFARENGLSDERITIDVIIAEVLVYYEDIEVLQGSDVELMCSSGGVPMQYCRYISPSGDAYHLKNNQSSNTISYSGRGLEYGECGIEITNVNTSEHGNWTCITRLGLGFQNKEIRGNIKLNVINSGLGAAAAASIGVSVGLIIILIIFGGVRFYKRKKQPVNTEEVELTETQRSYNTIESAGVTNNALKIE